MESTRQWSCSVMLQEKTQGTARRARGCYNPGAREYIRGVWLDFILRFIQTHSVLDIEELVREQLLE